MFDHKHVLIAPLTLLAFLTFPLWTNGCSGGTYTSNGSSSSGSGSTPDAAGGGDGGGVCTAAEAGGSAASQVGVQAVADFAESATSTVDGVRTSCRTIAQALDASKADQDAAEASTGTRAIVNAWCSLAVKTIGAARATAGGTLRIDAQPTSCEASVAEKARCQANCSDDGKCDIRANPPKCTGGALFIKCKGSCIADAASRVKCEGTCEGSCEGSCSAPGGVACVGKCNGTCSGDVNGSGIQSDGTCKGTCKGDCEVTAPAATCAGTCNGACSATCAGTAEVPVKCDGKCDADYDFLTCEGGKLEGGCNVDARCDGSCDVTVVAKAVCTPHDVVAAIGGAADVAAAGRLVSAIDRSLGAILAFDAHLAQMSEVSATLSISAGALTDVKAACLPVLVATASSATGDVKAALAATKSVIGATR